MLKMDPFITEHPTTVDEVCAVLSSHQAAGRSTKIVAGGTDVVPNLKHGLFEPDVVVHIGRVQGLKGVVDDGDHLLIGALTSLHDLSLDPLVRAFAPGLG